MSEKPPVPPEDEPLFPENPVTDGPSVAGPAEPVAPVSLPHPPEAPRTEQPPVIEPLKQEPGKFTRFMQGTLRVISLSLVMLLIGFLLGYFLLYKPTDAQLTKTHDQLTSTTQLLDKTRGDYDILKEQYANLLADTTLIEAHASLAMALRSTELALQGLKDQNGPVARAQTQITRTHLDQFRKYLSGVNMQQDATDLDSQMKAVETELVRDPTAAGPALEKLLKSLESFNELLFVTK